MIPTDRPRFHLCVVCVAARSIERDARFARVAVDVAVSGVCDDCKVRVDELEAWRPVDVPDPAPTMPYDLDNEGEPTMTKPTTVRPLRDVVLLQPYLPDERTKGGIIIPESARDDAAAVRRGIVRAVGPGRELANGRRVEPSVKVDDHVLFTTPGGAIDVRAARVVEDDPTPILVLEADIIGVIG